MLNYLFVLSCENHFEYKKICETETKSENLKYSKILVKK